MDLTKYFRPDLATIEGYVPGEQPRHPGGLIKLNTNECPYPPSPAVGEALARFAADGLRRYPDPNGNAFREAAAATLGVHPEQVVPVNGSDEALTILARATCSAGDTLAAPTPSYLLYRILAQLQGCHFAEIPFGPDGDLPDGFAAGAKLAVVPNPNSPTGSRMPPKRLAELAGKAGGLLVVDEAYADFADGHCVPLIAAAENLAVTRTFSKAFALAGLRFGFVVARREVAGVLRAMKDSYNCDMLSIALATAAWQDTAYYADIRRRILATRERLAGRLAALGFAVAPSHANFLWCTMDRPLRPVMEALKARGVLVRHLAYLSGEGLRISVGTDAECDRLLAELADLAGRGELLAPAR